MTPQQALETIEKENRSSKRMIYYVLLGPVLILLGCGVIILNNMAGLLIIAAGIIYSFLMVRVKKNKIIDKEAIFEDYIVKPVFEEYFTNVNFNAKRPDSKEFLVYNLGCKWDVMDCIRFFEAEYKGVKMRFGEYLFYLSDDEKKSKYGDCFAGEYAFEGCIMELTGINCSLEKLNEINAFLKESNAFAVNKEESLMVFWNHHSVEKPYEYWLFGIYDDNNNLEEINRRIKKAICPYMQVCDKILNFINIL